MIDVIESIRARNIGIIWEVEIDLNNGLNVVTGETGAGKTLFTQAILSGLGMISGNEIIGNHADSSFVEIQLKIPENFSFDFLNDDREVTIRREFSITGKSKSFFNGRLVPANFLREVGRKMIAIHSQNSHLEFLKRSYQLKILDGYDEALQKEVKEYKKKWKYVTSILDEIEELKETVKKVEKEKEILEFQLKEIESARLSPGEDEKLKQIRERLRHFQKIYEALYRAASFLKEGESSSAELLAQAEKAISEVAHLDAEFLGLKESVSKVCIEVEEIYREIKRHIDVMIEDEIDIDEVESRLSLIDSLKKKYGGTIESVLSYGEEVKRKLEKSFDADVRLKKLEDEFKKEIDRLIEKGKLLSELRRNAARNLEKRIKEKLSELMMPYLEFKINFESIVTAEDIKKAPRENLSAAKKGFEEVDFVIKNPGSEFKPISEIASGGELSRILLSLETVLGEKNTIPVFIFDEVDSGIGGNAGIVLGKYLRQLSSYSQVICVTHLPQVAAYGDLHILIERKDEGQRTEAEVKLLDYDERVEELARMLSGEVAKNKAIEHAEALLKSVKN